MPETIYFRPGDIVYDKSYPNKKYKILELWHSPFKQQLFMYVENQDTGEVEMVISDWVTDREPGESLWRDDTEVKKSAVSQEDNIHRIIASWKKLSKSEVDQLGMLLGSKLVKITGSSDAVVDRFLEKAIFRQAPDETYWVVSGKKRIGFRLASDGEIDTIVFFINAAKVEPELFFTIDDIDDSFSIRITSLGDTYLLYKDGKKYVLSREDFDVFCEDYGLKPSVIKSNITRHGSVEL